MKLKLLGIKKAVINDSFYFGWMRGLEPPTFGTTIRRSNQLSYNHRFGFVCAKIHYYSLLANNSVKIFQCN